MDLPHASETSVSQVDVHRDGVGGQALACTALYGKRKTAISPQEKIRAAPLPEDCVPCQWWDRCAHGLQGRGASEATALSAAFAAKGRECRAAASIIISAARQYAWPEVLNGIFGLLSMPDAALCGLKALKMVLSTPATQAWVWASEDVQCTTIEEGMFADANVNLDKCTERVMHACTIPNDMGWKKESERMLDKLLAEEQKRHHSRLHIIRGRHLDIAVIRSDISNTLCALGRHQEHWLSTRQPLPFA